MEFYGDAAEGFEAQLVQLSKAEHFIFMEYHVIEESQSFAHLKEFWADRVRHGVEARVLYDNIYQMHTPFEKGFDLDWVRKAPSSSTTAEEINPGRETILGSWM